jgi:HPt (histidine-containing phosphotransfer) domain-containing protein
VETGDPPTGEHHVFHLDEALSRIDHDLDIFYTIVELFVELGPKDFLVLKAAVEAGNPDAVAHSAHRLKGAVMQFCAPATIEAARTLEGLGKAGDLTGAGVVCAQLETELARLVDALQRTLDKRLAA